MTAPRPNRTGLRAPDEVTIYSMMATPFTDDGGLDLDAYAASLESMCDAGVGVYLGSGGAGEGHALSVAELAQLYRTGVQVCRGRVPVAANPREPRTAAQMLELAGTAAEAGVDLVQLYPLDAGHGMRPRPDELERYYTFLLDRLDHPVALSAHVYFSYPIAPRFLAELCAAYPQVEAVNAAMPARYIAELQEALRNVPRDIGVYTTMTALVEGLYLGSSGVQAAEPNIVPNVMRRLVDSVLTGELETAAELVRFVHALMRVCARWAPSTARWLKMARRVLGGPGSSGVLREPYVLPGDAELADLAAEFARLDVAGVEARCAQIAAERRR